MINKSLYFFNLVFVFSFLSCTKSDVNDSRALEASGLPVVSTSSITSVTDVSAVGGGVIISDGGDDVVSRGICWSTSANPTILNSTTSNGSGTGNFSAVLNGLTPNTTYYVRAYATNGNGTAYGAQVSFTTSVVLAIGSIYQGGIVFYLDSSGAHGLISAASDQSSSTIWGCPGITISGADGSEVGAGQQNTIDILASCPDAAAALLCDTLTLNGYSDWFLPSKDELLLMYTNLHLTGQGNFTGLAYWSSTEMTTTFAWQIIFSNGILQGTTKNNPISVRAIREF